MSVARAVPTNITLPPPTTQRERILNQAILDLYRTIQRRLDIEITSDVVANIPDTDGSDRIFFATDDNTLWFDTTAGWVNIVGALPPTGGSLQNLTVEVPDAGDVDPWIQFTITGTKNWRIGIDDSDSDTFVIAASTALGTSNVLQLGGGASILSTTLQVLGLTSTGNISITNAASGSAMTLSVLNSSNTAGSGANVALTVAGTSAGDAWFTVVVSSGASWALGVDNSASDAFVIANSTVLGTTNVLSIATTTGDITIPLGDLSVSRSDSGVRVDLTCHNSSDTANSKALIQSSVGGASSGNAWFRASISGVANWSFGVDNADSDAFQICPDTDLGTAVYALRIDTSKNATFAGTVSLTGGNLDVTRSVNASINITISNTSDTASAKAFLLVSVGGTSASDALAIFRIGVTQDWAVGIDNSDGDKFKIASATTLGTASTDRLIMPTAGGVVIGGQALATNATDGFLYIPTCAGAPTGAPTAQTGTVAMVYDTTNNRFYIYNGAWKTIKGTAGTTILPMG